MTNSIYDYWSYENIQFCIFLYIQIEYNNIKELKNMLTYSFKESDIPMYEYLYQCIKNDIIHQKLKPHEIHLSKI